MVRLLKIVLCSVSNILSLLSVKLVIGYCLLKTARSRVAIINAATKAASPVLNKYDDRPATPTKTMKPGVSLDLIDRFTLQYKEKGLSDEKLDTVDRFTLIKRVI